MSGFVLSTLEEALAELAGSKNGSKASSRTSSAAFSGFPSARGGDISFWLLATSCEDKISTQSDLGAVSFVGGEKPYIL